MQMQNPFLYPGRGLALRAVAASTGNALAVPETTTIPNSGFSEIIAAHDCLELSFEFVFGAAATGNVLIEEVIDKTASVAGETYATVAATSERIVRWNAGKPLQGMFRIQNTSGQSLTAYCQKRIN